MAGHQQAHADIGAQLPDRRFMALGLAVLMSLAIHGGIVLLIPGQTDRGVANFGQGGTTISLGPAGRDAGGEVAVAHEMSETPEEAAAIESEVIAASEPTEILEAEVVSEVPEPDLTPVEQVLEASDIQPPAIEALEVETPEVEVADVETAEVALAELPPVQSEAVLPTAKVVTPPLPVRRPQVQKKPVVQERQKAQTTAEPKKVVKPATATLSEQQYQASTEVTEGDNAAETSNQVAGQGGRSGQSGLSDAGQGDNTAGGGAPGADSDYYREIQAWLEKHKRYPRRSKLRNEQGVVLLRFVVTRDGTVTVSGIKKSSGHKRLDNEAMGMIERAQPLPAMPDDMRQAKLDLVIPVKFHLQ